MALQQATELPGKPDPQHVAIIMDGNGRWAQQRQLPRNEGHRQGVENVRNILRAARDADLPYLTLYAFSAENWRRPPLEVQALMGLLEAFLKQELDRIAEHETRLHIIGDVSALPPRIVRLLERVQEKTRHYDRWHLTLALNYGARHELLRAVRRYVEAVATGEQEPEALDWERWSQFLDTAELPDPDLVIRTSGETRLSNFLLLQSAYAEYYFSPKLWPDFGPEDFYAALNAYRQRERRFGRTGEQVRQSPDVAALLA